MTYEVPVAPGEKSEIEETTELRGESWPMWEVFVRARRGISHVHIGSLHAPDAVTALENARDVYTRARRRRGVCGLCRAPRFMHSSPMRRSITSRPMRRFIGSRTTYEIPEEVGQM